MNNLDELIGREVKVLFEEGMIEIKCKVIDVIINDFHFEESNEPIAIYVNLIPIENYNGELVDVDDFESVPLDYIRKK